MPEKEKYYSDIISGLAERTIRRLWISNIILTALLAVSCVCWILCR